MLNSLHVFVFPDLCLAGLNTRISLSQLYGSSSAVSVVCQAVCHMAMTRALFCRDLLILQKLYLRFGDNVCQHTHTHALTDTHIHTLVLSIWFVLQQPTSQM